MAFLITPMLHNVVPFDVDNGFTATFGILGGEIIDSATFTITSQISATAIVSKTVAYAGDIVTSQIREFSYTFTSSDLSALSNGTRYVMTVVTSNSTLVLTSKKSNMVLLQAYTEPTFTIATDIIGTEITKPTINITLTYSQAQNVELNYYYVELIGVKSDATEVVLEQTEKEYNAAALELYKYPMPNNIDDSDYISYKIVAYGQMKGGTPLTYTISDLTMRQYSIDLAQEKFIGENLCAEGRVKLTSIGASGAEILDDTAITIPDTYDGVINGGLEIRGNTTGGGGTPSVPINITNVESPIPLWNLGGNSFPKMASGATGEFAGLDYEVQDDGTIDFNGTISTDGASLSCPPLDDFYFVLKPSAFGTTNTCVIEYLNGEWFAGGSVGSLAKSSDGISWTSLTSGFGTSSIYGLAYNDGLYIAVGDTGKLATSADGVSWTLQTSGFGTSNIRDIAFGNGVWVACGNDGKISTSTNGTSWILRDSGLSSGMLRGIAYGNNIFVCAGQNGRTLTSSDGITWTERTNTFGTNYIYRVSFGKDKFVAVGELGKMSYSYDGINWNNINNPLGTTALWNSAYGNNMWIATGAITSVAYSYDGKIWMPYNGDTEGSGTLEAVGYGNGKFMFGGTGIYYGFQTPVQKADEIYWTSVNSGFGASDIWYTTFGNNMWISCGNLGKLFTSIDGTTWVQQTSGFGTSTIQEVRYANNLWVAVGDGGKIATSINGIDWSLVSDSSFGTAAIYAINYGGGLWVAVADGGLLATSPDGTTWTQQISSFGTTKIRSVVYANNLWVAVGYTGKIATSSDGITWTQQTSSTALNLFTVTYANGLFVAVGGAGCIVTSPNGSTWTNVASSGFSVDIVGLAYGNGIWMIGGHNGQISTSTDTVNWTQLLTQFGTSTIWTVGYGNGLFIAGGSSGKLNISLTKNRHIQLNKPYTLSTSTYLGSKLYPQLYILYSDNTREFVSATTASQTFTPTKEITALDYRLVTSNSSGDGVSATFSPQLEYGTYTQYYPYDLTEYSVPIKDVDDNIYTLDRLSSTIYDRIYYNMADGKWYIEKQTHMVTFNGTTDSDGVSENWFKSSSISNNVYVCHSLSNVFRSATSSVVYPIISTHFVAISYTSNQTTSTIGVSYDNVNNVALRFGVSLSGISTLANWKTWLASNNVTVVYRLATPVSYELHADTVAILENLLSKNGSTSLYSTDTISPYFYYIDFDGLMSGKYVIKRRLPTDLVWLPLKEYTITDAADAAFYLYDTYNASNTTYQYALVPINTNGTEGTYLASEVDSQFTQAYLCDYNKLYSIYNELTYDSMERVQNSQIIAPFGAQYPTVRNNAILNYDKGTITYAQKATDYTTATDIDRAAEIDLRKEFMAFATNKLAKILKDYNGNIWLVFTTNGVRYAFMKELANGVVNNSFDWVEKGDPNDIDDMTKMGMLNKFVITVT